MALWFGLAASAVLCAYAYWDVCREDRRMARLRELGDRRWARDESRMPDPAGLPDLEVVELEEWATCLEWIQRLPVGSPRGW